MAEKKSPKHLELLRKMAESSLCAPKTHFPEPICEDISELIHELQVHQVELDMQKEELNLAYSDLFDVHTQYVDLYYNNSPSAYITVNPKGIITQINTTGIQFLQIQDVNWTKLAFSRLIDPVSEGDYFKVLKQLKETGEKKRVDLKLKTGTKKEFWVRAEIQPDLDAHGNQIQRRMVLIDICETKRVEQKLIQSKKEWEDIFQAIGHPTVILDKSYRIRDANDATLKLTGLPKKQLIGRTCFNIFHKTKCPPDACPAKALLLKGSTKPIEVEMDAFGKNFLIKCTPIFDRHGQIKKMIHLATDITEVKALEKQVKQQHKTEAVSNMAGGVAHNFNNMLFAITGTLEYAKSLMPEDSEAAHMVGDAIRMAFKASKVSKSMLTFLGQDIINKKQINLVEQTKSCVDKIHSGFSDSVVLKTNFSPAALQIDLDPSQLEEMLKALLNNAYEAVEKSDEKIVRVTTQIVKKNEIPAKYRFPGDWEPDWDQYACITVKDSGPGIEKKAIESIFDPFYSDKFPGRGMGLPLALGILKANDGGISLKSRPGRTVFCAYFPVPAIFELQNMDQQLETRQLSGKKPVVLLVEDEKIIRGTMEAALNSLGFEVVSVDNGMKAVALFKKIKDEIQLLVIDYQMPQMNGLQTMSEIKKIKPGAAVILTSGYTQINIHDTLQEKPDAFLGKPFLIDDLKKQSL